jgi:hypothetical protein
MGKTLTTMKTNVGKQIRDTSSAFAAVIAVFINDKRRDVWRRCMWSATIDDNYTFESVVGTATYDLPSDFDTELFVANIAKGRSLERMTQGQFWRERASAYQSDTISNGTSIYYSILEEVITSSGYPYGQLRLDPPPDTAETYAMPYRRKFTDLIELTGQCDTDTASKIIDSDNTFITSGVKPGMRVKNTTDNTYSYISSVDSETQLTIDSDLCPDGNENFTIAGEIVIPDIDWIVELGSIGEAWAYKRQFQKANYYLNRYEVELRRRIGQERSKINQRYQMISENYRTAPYRRFSGDTSYDTI